MVIDYGCRSIGYKYCDEKYLGVLLFNAYASAVMYLQAVVVTATNDAWSRKDAVLPALKENWKTVLMGMRHPARELKIKLMASLFSGWTDASNY